MKKRFVTFFSPGTLFAETTTKPVESWNVKEAVEMARSITERYYAKPYGFQFSIRERKDDGLDSRETEHSPMYFLGGKVLTLQEIKDRNDPKDSTLISNMESNHFQRVIENCNSWKVTLPLNDNDVVLDVSLETTASDKPERETDTRTAG